MRDADANPVWSIILAGGEGERTRPFIERWLGRSKPKQYCTFVGHRSMLQHTLDRADRLGAPRQKVTVVSQHHQEFFAEAMSHYQKGQVLVQPVNCDTGAGVFFPLTYVRQWNPNATVVLFPSDHFIFPEDRFVETVRRAIRASEIFRDRLFLLGVRPTHLELDYGWIKVGGVLGWSGGSCIYHVDSFLEKPGSSESLQALANGALWNTLVLVAKVETLWQLGVQYLPMVLDRFSLLSRAIGTNREGSVLRQIYQQMPAANFSSELLQHASSHIGVLELEEVLWSDWGRPDRIQKTLESLGKEPAFPSSVVEPPTSSAWPQSSHNLEVV